MIHAHKAKLTEIAEANGLRPLSGAMSPGQYIGYALDLALVGMGLLKAQDVPEPDTVYEEFYKRNGREWRDHPAD